MMPLLRAIIRVGFRVKVVGRENIPKDTGGLILACNHIHFTDPAFLAALSHRMWRFVAKEGLFQKKPIAWFLRHCNAFPVDRNGIDREALDFAIAVLEYGSPLGIFPEGQRSPDGTPQQAKTGIGMIARRTHADILPCSIYREGGPKFGARMTIRFGEVIPFARLGLDDRPNARQMREASAMIMDEIRNLWALGY
jgi:1-acyl-sn-glycerol-3-phosphate acyltransferase